MAVQMAVEKVEMKDHAKVWVMEAQWVVLTDCVKVVQRVLLWAELTEIASAV